MTRPAERDGGGATARGYAGSDGRHFVDLLGLHQWMEPAGPRARALLRPSMWVPGTRRPRLGVLATMVDMVGGLVPEGFVTPTVDLRIGVVDALPPGGHVDLACTVHKRGTRLLVSETLLRCDGRLVARGSTTFLADVRHDDALLRDTPPPDHDVETFDAVLGATVVDHRTLELAPGPEVTNGDRATVQGGVQATLVELAAEHALGGPGAACVTDIDIRYLRSLRVGPMHARAEVLGTSKGVATVRVELTDAGADHRMVALGAATAVSA